MHGITKKKGAGILAALVLMAGIAYAVVNPVTNPDPPHTNFARATYVWGATDELGTDTKQQNLLNFCSMQGVNVIFLDIWTYLGGGNWTDTKRTNVQKFVDAAHKSGIRVYALSGNVDWGVNHAWVHENITQRLARYQALYNATYPSSKFDGVILDVEYWTDETTYPAATNLPGLCDLIRSMRARLDHLPVGCFSGFFLKDDTATRPTILYNGKTAQDGEHLMDAADFVVIGTYRDDAASQLALWSPWYNYAKTVQSKSVGLFVGTETTNVSPANITYFGDTKTNMVGVAVHDYVGWKAMAN